MEANVYSCPGWADGMKTSEILLEMDILRYKLCYLELRSYVTPQINSHVDLET